MRDAVHRFFRRVWYLVRLRRLDADLSEELEFHRAMKQSELENDGLSARGARLQARRAMGNVGLARDRARDLWQPRWLQGTGLDLRLALRALVASPLLSAVAIASLALGIGANTAIFSLVNSLLLRTLPVAEPERLVTLSTDAPMARGSRVAWTYRLWDEMRPRAAQTFDGAVAWTDDRLNLSTAGGEVQAVEGAYVSGDFFRTLGVPAVLGRTFTAVDDVPGGGPDGPVAVISHGMWQGRFGGDQKVIGTSLVIERIPFTIIGVTPPEFFGAEVGRTFDVAVPLSAQRLIRGKDSAIDKGAVWLYIMVRLKAGQSAQTATSLLRSVEAEIRKTTNLTLEGMPPGYQYAFPFTLVPAFLGTSRLRQRYEQPLLVTLGLVGLVLLIACGNIANLLLARTSAPPRRDWRGGRTCVCKMGESAARRAVVDLGHARDA
jgi:putative ABC transport system permease protein